MKFRKLLVFVVVLAVIIFVLILNRNNIIRYGQTKLVFGTIVTVDVCVDKKFDDEYLKKIYDEIWDETSLISKNFDVHNDASLISRINRSDSLKVEIPADVVNVFAMSKKYSKITEGFFDITVYPLIQLWKQKVSERKLPQKEEVDAALNYVGFDGYNIENDRYLIRRNKDIKFDLGAIAKGYAVDKISEIFRKHGFNDFYIDAGGDLYVGGMNCHGKKWHIGIRNPRKNNEIVDVVKLSNQAITTSGDYERFFEIDNVKYSHIINAKTGWPQKDIISATVIAPTAIEADALSTAFCILDENISLNIIKNLGPKFYGFLIKKDVSIENIKSKNYNELKK